MRSGHTYAASRGEIFGGQALTDDRSQPPASKSARKPGPLGAAEARLEAALDRFEAALDGAEARIEERAEDRAAMTRLREENAALQQTRAEVSDRLDAAVERLRRALAH